MGFSVPSVHGSGPSTGWVGLGPGLGPVVKISKNVVHNIAAVTDIRSRLHASKQSGSSRASPVGMRAGMKTHKSLKKA